ncbi:MAG: hypothetical protein JWR81_3620, partial [Pseudonocardia sp.]|nr:hypothetical protein [Pseudonocardia sp.]
MRIRNFQCSGVSLVTDAGGRRWEITEGVEPHPVLEDDEDLEYGLEYGRR